MQKQNHPPTKKSIMKDMKRISDQIWKINNLNVYRFRNEDLIKDAQTAEESQIDREKMVVHL